MMSSKFILPIAIQFAFTVALFCSGCTTDVAGTDEQTNSIANNDGNESSSSVPSSSPIFPVSSSSTDGEPTDSGTGLPPGSNGNGAMDPLPNQFDVPVNPIPESIFTLDTLQTGPTSAICTGDQCNIIDTRKKIIGTKGTFYYKMEPWEAKVECEANDSQSSSYSVSKYGSTIKKFASLDKGEVEMFKQDCIAEGGHTESGNTFYGIEGLSNSTICTLNDADEFYYYDNNWSKYSQIILNHCNTTNL